MTDRLLRALECPHLRIVGHPTGRILQEIPMGREGIIYARVQPRRTTTPYVRYGDWFARVACLAVIIATVRAFYERRHSLPH